jgi:ribosomal protein S18 acetylase RimI-like enzyme
MRSITHIWLGVWEDNPRGIAFYKKKMFVDVGSTFYMVGPDKQIDRVMVSSMPLQDLDVN